MRKGLVTALSLALVVGGGLLTTASTAQADITTGLVLDYNLDETSGTVVHDSSGNGRDGTVLGTTSWGGTEGLTFNGTNTYVKVPDNIMAGLSSITVSYDVWIDPALSGNYFTYGFGNSSSGYGNGYLFNTGNALHASITASDYLHEQKTGQATALARGAWKQVTYTQTGTTGIMYLDGVEVARNTAVTVTPGSIGGGVTTADYIGRSLFSADSYFKGKMRDFRVYNRALSSGEVVNRDNDANLQWQELQAMAEYNGALTVFEDPKIGPVIIFPSDYTGNVNDVEPPPDWKDSAGHTPTMWPSPTTAKSQLFTSDQIADVQTVLYDAIQPDGDMTYTLGVHYDGMSDRIVVQTNAPSSVTDPLVSAYPGQLTLDTSTVLPASAPACTPAQAGVTKGLVVDYKLDETVGTNVHDSSGNGNDGQVVGTADLGGDNGLGFNGTDTAVRLPNNVMTGMNSITVDFDVQIDSTQGAPYMFYGLGNTSGSMGNGYLFTTGTAFRTSLSMTDYTAKQDVKPTDTTYGLARGVWKHVTYTQTGTTGILYENGVEKARNTNVTITPGAIGGGTTTANFIGKSLYSNDQYFKGRMRDFRVYDRALSPVEVADRADNPDTKWEQIQALADHNCALAYFEDPVIGPVIIFPKDYEGDINDLQTPLDWTDHDGVAPTTWPTVTTAKSQMFTAADIKEAIAAAYAKIAPDLSDTYNVTVGYDGMSDRVLVTTDAPASVTDSLVTDFPAS
ncbi:LamG domain-containing protein [Streptomyces sp. NBC_01485]|uniref:LamG domain-containing protein n=1 Tax=Streptomyces sp. NBC_01485 TaxID=2903884 RepID=UPI002E34B1AA|nr:LamG domain-containing protein [Streptomyces sp. NBC_01485]